MSRLRLPAERLGTPGGVVPGHDPLTGLPNRALLLDRLHVAVARAERGGTQVAALVVDLEDLAGLTRRHGAGAGDRLLRHVAALLRTGVRGSDTASRFDQDQFVVLLSDLPDEADMAARTDGLRRRIAAPCDWQGGRLRAAANIGVALYPRDVAQPDLLLHLADAAMFQARVRNAASRARTLVGA